MECPRCGYVMQPVDVECERCRRTGPPPETDQDDGPQPAETHGAPSGYLPYSYTQETTPQAEAETPPEAVTLCVAPKVGWRVSLAVLAGCLLLAGPLWSLYEAAWGETGPLWVWRAFVCDFDQGWMVMASVMVLVFAPGWLGMPRKRSRPDPPPQNRDNLVRDLVLDIGLFALLLYFWSWVLNEPVPRLGGVLGIASVFALLDQASDLLKASLRELLPDRRRWAAQFLFVGVVLGIIGPGIVVTGEREPMSPWTYEHIAVGMTVDQVRAVAGEPRDTKTSQTTVAGVPMASVYWYYGPRTVSVQIGFQSGRVHSKRRGVRYGPEGLVPHERWLTGIGGSTHEVAE